MPAIAVVAYVKSVWRANVREIPPPDDYWIKKWINNFEGCVVGRAILATADKAAEGAFRTPTDAHKFAYGCMKSSADDEALAQEAIEDAAFLLSLTNQDGEISI